MRVQRRTELAREELEVVLGERASGADGEPVRERPLERAPGHARGHRERQPRVADGRRSVVSGGRGGRGGVCAERVVPEDGEARARLLVHVHREHQRRRVRAQRELQRAAAHAQRLDALDEQAALLLGHALRSVLVHCV